MDSQLRFIYLFIQLSKFAKQPKMYHKSGHKLIGTHQFKQLYTTFNSIQNKIKQQPSENQ